MIRRRRGTAFAGVNASTRQEDGALPPIDPSTGLSGSAPQPETGDLGARVTVSIGAATLSEITPAEDAMVALLELADRRMYLAKTSGRNRVCVTWEGRGAAVVIPIAPLGVAHGARCDRARRGAGSQERGPRDPTCRSEDLLRPASTRRSGRPSQANLSGAPWRHGMIGSWGEAWARWWCARSGSVRRWFMPGPLGDRSSRSPFRSWFSRPVQRSVGSTPMHRAPARTPARPAWTRMRPPTPATARRRPRRLQATTARKQPTWRRRTTRTRPPATLPSSTPATRWPRTTQHAARPRPSRAAASAEPHAARPPARLRAVGPHAATHAPRLESIATRSPRPTRTAANAPAARVAGPGARPDTRPASAAPRTTTTATRPATRHRRRPQQRAQELGAAAAQPRAQPAAVCSVLEERPPTACAALWTAAGATAGSTRVRARASALPAEVEAAATLRAARPLRRGTERRGRPRADFQVRRRHGLAGALDDGVVTVAGDADLIGGAIP